MSILKNISYLEDNQKDYIENVYNLDRLEKNLKDLEEAQTVINDLMIKLYKQYNRATMVTEYKQVKAVRYHDQYSTKRVYIDIFTMQHKLLDGENVYSSHVYGDTKRLTYQEMKEPRAYAAEQMKKYPGDKYTNETT